MAAIPKRLGREFAAVYGRQPAFATRAPGRVEFIGNHTDYNGGTVLGAAIDRGTCVAIAPRADRRWRFHSSQGGRIVSIPCGNLRKQTGAKSWVNYLLGVIAAFPGFGLRRPEGFDCHVSSDVPTGAGLSSSAALELSSALAFLALTNQSASREAIVKIGRHAENNFVGVPSGILDQGVSGFGEKNRLVWIDCRVPEFDTVPLPAEAQFWIFNTHTKHALVDGLYAARHESCMAAAKALGVDLLVDASVKDLEAKRSKLTPENYKRARHVIDEIRRVAATVKALRSRNLKVVGRLLVESHESSRTLFENSTPELDFLVEALVAEANVYGARLTGGGFGGAVMALTSTKFSVAQARRVSAAYRKKFRHAPDILRTQAGAGATRLA